MGKHTLTFKNSYVIFKIYYSDGGVTCVDFFPIKRTLQLNASILLNLPIADNRDRSVHVIPYLSYVS